MPPRRPCAARRVASCPEGYVCGSDGSDSELSGLGSTSADAPARAARSPGASTTPGARRLCLLQLARRVSLRLGQQLACFVARGVERLGALPLVLLPLALDVELELVDVAVPAR